MSRTVGGCSILSTGLLNQLRAQSLLLTRVEKFDVHSKDRAATEHRPSDFFLKSSGLDGACRRWQWHVSGRRDVLLAFVGEGEVRERCDFRAGGGSSLDIDEQRS